MATINAIAHKNELTKDVKNDFYLTAQVTGTLYLEDIIARLTKREIATKNVNGAAFVQLFLDECAAAAAEGYNVVTSFFRSSISIQGVIYDKDLGHNIEPSRLKVTVNLTQGEGAIKAIGDATVYAFEQSGAVGPVIQSVYDPTNNEVDSLPFRGMALIQGMRLALKGDDPKVGITFTPADTETGDTPVFIPATKVSPNTPAKLQFVLPAEVTTGNWRVKVCTQSSGSGAIVKDARSYEYENVVSVY